MRFVSRGWGARQTWWIDGRQVTKEEFDAALPNVVDEVGTGDALLGWKPLLSDALAVHPEQIAEAEASAKAKGVPTEFEPEYGRPVFTSRSHRRAYLRAYGMHDNQGGYGD